MRIWTILVAGSAACILLTGAAATAALTKTTVSQDGPRINLAFRFDKPAECHAIYNYAKNTLVVQVAGLKFSRQQLHNGPAVHSSDLTPFIKAGSFNQDGETGEVRLQLTKSITPADALLIQRESGFDLQFVLPESSAAKGDHKAPAPHTAHATADKLPTGHGAPPAGKTPEPAAQSSGDSTPSTSGNPPAGNNWSPPAGDNQMTSLTGQTFSDPPVKVQDGNAGDTPDANAAPDSTTGAAPASDPPAETPQTGATPAPDANFIPDNNAGASSGSAPDSTAAPDDPANDDPAHDLHAAAQLKHSIPPLPSSSAAPPASGAPSYKRFDLSQVQVKQLEIKGLPFREALSELVAGCGFNVVVGKNIDNEPVYLNFTQKQLSLKSALETLCMAYELAYSIQDDAIVITKQ